MIRYVEFFVGRNLSTPEVTLTKLNRQVHFKRPNLTNKFLMSILVILALLGVFGLSILFLFKNSKVVKVNKSEDESKEKHRQVPHEELEGEKFPFDLEEFAGFDKNTGRCSEDCLHLLEKRAKAHPSRVAYIWVCSVF